MPARRRSAKPPAAYQSLSTPAPGLHLRGPGVQLRIEALADDLLHLQWTHGTRGKPTPSWVVSPWTPSRPAVQTRIDATTASITTAVGTVAIDLRSGAWSVTDRHGLQVFSAGTGATTVSKTEATLTLDLAERESVFGLGETTGTFNRRGLQREFWNIDVLGHAPAIHPALKQLYVSIPFALSMQDGRAAGVFWDTPARQSWDIGQTRLDRWQMKASTGAIDLYLFLGPGVDQVVSRYTQLTGAMPLPPKWGLGYQQSRYSYETQERVEEIAREFRKRRLPCDVLYLDIHHMEGYRVFTFGKTFPKPAEMIRRLGRKGFKVVTIVDPGVKNDPKFGVLQRGRKADAFVKAPDGKTDYLGEVWPGESRFPDFLNAGVRAWWAREQQALSEQGVAGIWNDMNEPANFARPDKTLDPECLHRTDRGPQRHREVHNLYGHHMAQASREGLLAAGGSDPAQCPRPFVITRAGYAGIQRHALVWTGDNSSNWDHLNDAVQMFLNLSLSGVPFCGGDVGGFLENTTPELFLRWFQFSTFTPFFRNHSNIGTIDQEPWALGEPVEEICRTFLHLRYQLLPYLYCLFAEARSTGAPIMRPLLWHYPNDPVAVACGDQFLLGRDLMIAPVLRQGAVARSVYLPNDTWIQFWTGEPLVGGQHVVSEAPLSAIPLYLRAGAILPFGPAQQFVGEIPDDTLMIHCVPGPQGRLDWYEDDGETQAYEQGQTLRRTFTSRVRGRTWSLDVSPAVGPFTSRVKTWRLVLWQARHKGRLRLNGRPAPYDVVEDQDMIVADIPNDMGPIRIEYSPVV